METETEKIEARLGAHERDVAVIKSNYVTKEDLHRELSAQTWRVITFVTTFVCVFNGLLVSATYLIATHAK
jgi:hypothetical protein